MSTFCTVRDVRLALTPNAVEEEVARPETAAYFQDYQIEDAILEAEGIVAAHIAARYTIVTGEVEEINPEDPLETWVWVVAPSPIRAWTRDVAAYLASLTFHRHKDIEEDDPIRLRFKMVMDNLIAVRDRKMNIDLPPIGDGTSGVFVINQYEGKLFGLEDVGLEYEGRSAQRIWPLRRDVV
jgi:hypothetical protein